MSGVYIVDAIRTPIGNFCGSLAPVRADDLAAHVLKELLLRHPNLNPAHIEDVLIGCANQAGEDNRNVARMALLLAGLPVSVPGETVNRLCASGLASVIHAGRAIGCNEGNLFIAGGMEHMTRGPWVISKTSTPFGRDAEMHDSSFGWRFVNPKMKQLFGTDAMGETAENLAEMFQISREDQDRFALWSQQKAARAAEAGRFQDEIAPVRIESRKGDVVTVSRDEFIKPNSTAEGLAKLRPSFRKEGTVTAGNASGLNDGACAILMASEAGLKENGLTPKTRIVCSAVAGVEPRIMGIGPVEATRKALRRANLTMDDLDIIEINEAFASQVLACTRQLGLDDQDARLNVNGGAIALGHPLGMSGSRLVQTASIELVKRQKKYALVTMCIGVGQGYAAILERM